MSDTSPDVERVEVLRQPLPPGMNWQPVVGQETTALMERLRVQQRLGDGVLTALRDGAAAILGRACSPDSPGRTTGLVLGQVQSGKTLSFTAVAAMARDNGYRVVIVITGTTTTLLDQSVNRLRRDLGLDADNRGWRHVPVVPQTDPDVHTIRDVLAEWDDPDVLPHDRRTILITVMKQHRNLRRLINVLRRLRLENVPTLIIDDEADQASLNIQVRTAGQSTTYLRVRELRDSVARHVFLQYTATPQALLLINIIDILSPSFVEVLEPGTGYHGGPAFFVERPELVREIPANELPTRQRPLVEPPETLFDALRLFFLGVAAGIIQDQSQGNRSMMIHPSERTDSHVLFQHWVEMTKQEWVRILERPDGDPDKRDLLDEFRRVEVDLRHTEPTLPPTDALLAQLKHAIRRARVQELNARRGHTPIVDWSNDYPFILVGGSAMDRGFTVRGLTVTYMPRGLGTGTADTLQQRGRFFGYRERSFGLCRVFLAADVRGAFASYVDHEADVRARLVAHRNSGRPLAEWARAFLLDSSMKPTRDSVIDIAYRWANLGGGWFFTRSPHQPADAVTNNRAVIARFQAAHEFVANDGHPLRTHFQKHLEASDGDLQDVLENLLLPMRFPSPHDSQQYVSLLLILRRIIENSSATTATVFVMSGGVERERAVDEHDRLPVLFQGAHPVAPESQRGSIYPGDDAIRATDGVTVQLHILAVRRPDGTSMRDIPALAIWIPPNVSRDLLVQPQGGARS